MTTKANEEGRTARQKRDQREAMRRHRLRKAGLLPGTTRQSITAWWKARENGKRG